MVGVQPQIGEALQEQPETKLPLEAGPLRVRAVTGEQIDDEVAVQVAGLRALSDAPLPERLALAFQSGSDNAFVFKLSYRWGPEDRWPRSLFAWARPTATL